MNKAAVAKKYAWALLAILMALACYFLEDDVRPVILKRLFGIHTTFITLPGGAKAEAWYPFTVFFSFRCLWNLLWFALLCALPGFTLGRSTLSDPSKGRHFALGLATGVAVMGVSIVLIIVSGNAQLAYLQDSLRIALAYGLGWIATSIIGAAAEELFFRGLVFSAVDRIGGRTAAIVISALAFSWTHVSNDGASLIWLVRLFLQGILLAYAVVRTGSLWWSIAYHAGWNWASAPLFGAAGSGYANEGHFFTFTPTGSEWITGGPVGPEGSVLAYAAMLAAFYLLMRFTTARGIR